ncbi:hypothetical protein RAF62_27335 [Klebsiella pneumoniae]
MSEEALPIAEKRKDAKDKGQKERYTHLNAEFQRIARRNKKVFLSVQCKEREENNKMRKTIDQYDWDLLPLRPLWALVKLLSIYNDSF